MTDTDAVVAIYDTHAAADEAVKELNRSGFNVKKLSVIGKGYHSDNQVLGFYNTGDRVKHWGKLGAFWGGLWGLLMGAAFLLVPGIGPLMVAGPVVAWIIGALEGAVVVGGLSALGAALFSIGIPKDSVLKYESAIKADKYVLLAHGTAEDAEQAREILDRTRPIEVTHHVLGATPQAAGA